MFKNQKRDLESLLSTFAAASRLQWGSCGVGGSVSANISLIDGSRCSGSITDWNPESCRIRSILTIDTTTRCPRLHERGTHVSFGRFCIMLTSAFSNRLQENKKNQFYEWRAKWRQERGKTILILFWFKLVESVFKIWDVQQKRFLCVADSKTGNGVLGKARIMTCFNITQFLYCIHFLARKHKAVVNLINLLPVLRWSLSTTASLACRLCSPSAVTKMSLANHCSKNNELGVPFRGIRRW